MLNSETIHPDKHLAERTAAGDRAFGAVAAIEPGENGAAVVRYAYGTATIALLGDRIVQVTVPAADVSGPSPGTGEVRLPPACADARAERDESRYVIRGGGLAVTVDLRSSSILFCGEDGEPFARQAGIARGDRWKASAYFEKSETSRFYGLGEKTGFLDKAGERYEMWNTDVYSPHVQDIDTLYQSIPFAIHDGGDGACYGIFVDNPGRTFFDMRTMPDLFGFGCETGALRYYVIAGADMKDVIGRYTELTGRMPLPPRWALGYHQSRYSYMDQEEVLRLARTFREKRIPCDAIYLDIHYMDGYRVFTFDRNRFPDPAGMIAELKSLGIRIVPIVDPGVKKSPADPVYREGLRGGHFCRYLEGGCSPAASGRARACFRTSPARRRRSGGATCTRFIRSWAFPASGTT